MKDKEVTNWWFTELKTDRSGVAWSGPNLVCTKVGVCWAAIDNPFPDKEIISLQFHAPLEGGMYALLGISLADKPFYIEPKGPSFGGPDNWAAGNGMAALVEGLAGVKNDGLAFDKVTLSPRWVAAKTNKVNATVSFPASNGYIAYRYDNNETKRQLRLNITGSGRQVKIRLLLPVGINSVVRVVANGKPVIFKIDTVDLSKYMETDLNLSTVQDILIQY